MNRPLPPNRFYTKDSPEGIIQGEPMTLSTRLILEAADELGIAWKILPGTKIIELEYQQKRKYFRYQISSGTTEIGFYSCLDKNVTNHFLAKENISISPGFLISLQDSKEYILQCFNNLQKPVVVKPTHGSKGKDITLGILDEQACLIAVEEALKFSADEDAGALIESQFHGQEYRVLATKTKVLAITNRIPANIVGDGQHTIAELISEKNRDPRRGTDFINFTLMTIEINDQVLEYLAAQHLTLVSVPSKNERVFLRENSNISTGGDSIDMTDAVHPSVKEIAIRTVNSIPGIDFAGVDFMSKDITIAQTPETYRIIEVNTSPGIFMHEFPFEGIPRNTPKEFLYLAFPELRPA